MRIISPYTDFYDFAVGWRDESDRQIVYARPEPKTTVVRGYGLGLPWSESDWRTYLNAGSILTRAGVPNNHPMWKHFSPDYRAPRDTTFHFDAVYNFGILVVCGVARPVLVRANMNINQMLARMVIEEKYLLPKSHLYGFEDMFRIGTPYSWRAKEREVARRILDTWCEQPRQAINQTFQSPLVLLTPTIKDGSLRTEVTVDVRLRGTGFEDENEGHIVYQEIESWFGQQIERTNPPVKVGNADLIVKNGFDPKVSFRTR